MPTQNPLADLASAERETVLRGLKPYSQHSLNARFPFWALDGQEPPRATASGADWRTWVIMAGRGFGKTRAGAEWVLGCARGDVNPPRNGEVAALPTEGRRNGGRVRVATPLHHASHGPPPRAGEDLRIALVAATVEEARAVMVEGPSGIIASARPDDIREWSPARRTLTFASGAQAFLYSGASPESLRGPEHDFAWCDELAKWRHPQSTWDNLSFGLRRGDWPRALITTTPRAGTVLGAILDLPDTVKTGGSTRANVYLPQAYVSGVEARYAGTRLGAQELDGVLLTDVEGSLWPVGLIAGSRVTLQGLSPLGDCPLSPELRPEQGPEQSPAVLPSFTRIVIGVDPPTSVSGTCGIVVCGLDSQARGVVLHDASVTGRSPEGWARAVADAAARWGADRVVVERNQGGDMVTSVLRAAQANLPIRAVHASRGKSARAEPVAALFESGRAVFAGVFPELEAELSGMQIAGGYAPGSWSGAGGPGDSPDRADAMVWALWALLLEPVAMPQVRTP